MEEKHLRSNFKRPVSEDDDDDDDDEPQRPVQKRPRFPKGKKVRKEDEISLPKQTEEAPSELTDPLFAAKERAKKRNQITAELFSEQSAGILEDVSAAEVNYEGNGNFEDDGVLIEPFNLKQERQEGYFDAAGNFVEYVYEKEAKDAWLDSVDAEAKFEGKSYVEIHKAETDKVEEFQDLSSEDIGKIKRRIANLLQPGETVLQALRRMKGISNDKKGRMPEETKRMFDQLTEDAMKLLENGEYNVYHEKQEVFEREADGYERLVRARESTSTSGGNGILDSSVGMDIFSDVVDPGGDMTSSHSNLNMPTAQVSSGDGDDSYDMFGEDGENTAPDRPSNGDAVGSRFGQESLVPSQSESEGGVPETDYVYDESSGYYYSSSLGYYYDPASGLYCCAVSGKWYSFNEQTGAYDEIMAEAVPEAN